MREIKFRAWNGKYMLNSAYGDWVSFDGVPYTEASRKHNTPNIEVEKAKDYILMQFTGLHDKNGKEIYEGDIVKCSVGHELRIDKPLEVIFANGAFQMNRPDWPFPCAFTSYANQAYERKILTDWNQVQNSIEIIGNIYENSDLIPK